MYNWVQVRLSAAFDDILEFSSVTLVYLLYTVIVSIINKTIFFAYWSNEVKLNYNTVYQTVSKPNKVVK